MKINRLFLSVLLSFILFGNNVEANSNSNQKIDSPISVNTISLQTVNFTTNNYKMPKFTAVDVKIGQYLTSIAAYLHDQSRDNIIRAAHCFKRQKGNGNIYIYFVNDKTYSIDRRIEETHKVIAVYVNVNNNGTLYFTNPDGSEKETMQI